MIALLLVLYLNFKNEESGIMMFALVPWIIMELIIVIASISHLLKRNS
jgi:hypothetical protein